MNKAIMHLRNIFLPGLAPVLGVICGSILFLSTENTKISSYGFSEITLTRDLSIKSESKAQGKENSIVSYNYDKVLNLLSQLRLVENSFYNDVKAFISDSKNLTNLEHILIDLKSERKFFKKYLDLIKKQSRYFKEAPKINSLRYYLRVIKDKIHMTIGMIKKFSKN